MLRNLRQIVPSSFCLKCDVCCRYPERTTTYLPSFFAEEAKDICHKGGGFSAIGKKLDLRTPPIPYKDHYICSFFLPERNGCRIYPSRPLDCQLYPFMVTYGKDYESIVLVLDSKCPYLKDNLDSKEVKAYIDYLVDIFEDEGVVEEINNNKHFINDFHQTSFYLKKLEKLSKRICLSEYNLTRLSLKDRKLFAEYFLKCDATLSSFNFSAIYIWSNALNILWKKISDTLCISAGGDRDYFLLLPPIGNDFNKSAVRESLQILSHLNEGGSATRIENIPQELYDSLASFGLNLRMTSQEYVYNQKSIAELKGDGFKMKRALVNHFVKSYKYVYRDLERKDIFDCLDLYREWASFRLKNTKDDYYRVLVEDSYFAQKIALMNLESLNLRGGTVEVDGVVRGYTLGYQLKEDTFVVLFETTDLNMKGLSQFIFREFSNRLSNYRYINALSDSGLENLKKVKDSYRPIKKIPVFTANP